MKVTSFIIGTIFGIALCATALKTTVANADSKKEKQFPIVHDSNTAKKIAEAVFQSNFSDEYAREQLPYRVIDKGESWLVRGRELEQKPGYIVSGGVAEVRIEKLRGCISDLNPYK